MSQLSDKALQIAITQIGQDEKPHGSNWGEPVRSYLISVGINFPASWCMAFMYWCFGNAAKALNVKNTAIKTGGVLAAWNLAPKELKAASPSIGSVVIFDHGHGLGHTGIVEKFDGKFIYTIEGNTNVDGSRNGYEVERKTRKRLDPTIKGYLNY
jgi:hypothetical protein